MVVKLKAKTLQKTGVVLLVLVIGFVFLLVRSINPVIDVEAKALREEFGDVYKEDVKEIGEVVEIDMEASEGKIEIFEGYETEVWSYNDQVPGPEIRINLSDTLKVNFTNNLPDETTIHWHGVRVPNDMDGIPDLTQDPIQPGETFVYEFTPKDSGTFWFHPHVRTAEQVERGLFGTLIVEDESFQNYSQDIVWVIDDWRLRDDYQIDPNFVTGHDLMHDGRWGNVITVNGSLEEIVKVNPGERIRLRLVNTSNGRVYSPSFGSLNAKIISVDGMPVKKEFDANGFNLAPGNRIDVDIKVPINKVDETIDVIDHFTRYPNKLGVIQLYGDPINTPTFEYPTSKDIPDWDEATNVSVDKEYILDARRGGPYGIEWTINGKAFPDYDPFELKYNEFNKIKLIHNSSRQHPMHLHGQFFKVITRNGVNSNEQYFRDTVLIKPNETIEIGLVPLDKGSWVNHCHTLEHAEAGMLTVIEVK